MIDDHDGVDASKRYIVVKACTEWEYSATPLVADNRTGPDWRHSALLAVVEALADLLAKPSPVGELPGAYAFTPSISSMQHVSPSH
jgi:hypothetical protein